MTLVQTTGVESRDAELGSHRSQLFLGVFKRRDVPVLG